MYAQIQTEPSILQFDTYTRMMNREQRFHTNLIKGHIGKELARAVLEKSGYKTYSFGYESLLSQLRYDVSKKVAPLTDSNNRLRSTPDLMVYDDQRNETHFVEVKFSKSDEKNRVRLRLRPLQWYKKYWNDSILVLVTPSHHVFYAQRIASLDISDNQAFKPCGFDLDKQFLPLEQIFSRVNVEIIRQFYPVLEEYNKIDGPDIDPEDDTLAV